MKGRHRHSGQLASGMAMALLAAMAGVTSPADVAADEPASAAAQLDTFDSSGSVEAAADEVAELGHEIRESGPQEILKLLDSDRDKAALGISIEADDDREQGVVLAGVTAGGPADAAGLQVGDLLLAVNGRPLVSADDRTAARQLVRFMRDVRPGDVIKVDYRRGEEERVVEVTAAAAETPLARLLRENLGSLQDEIERGGWDGLLATGRSFRSMELVALTPELGRYFGTQDGLLVLRAPADGSLNLMEGDVILAIGGRRPESPDHAVRILRSYQPGEPIELLILRDRKEVKLQAMLPEANGGKPRS
jgi:S1-C subfamily serine protease